VKTSTAIRAFALTSIFGGIAALFSPACATGPRREALDLSELGWPAGEPRVRMERVIATRRDAGVGAPRSFRWVTGAKEQGLFVRPFAVAWSGNDLAVADPGAPAVLLLTVGGKILRSKDGLFASPIGVAACGDQLMVTDSIRGRVAVLDRRLGFVRWLAEGLERPTGIACNKDVVLVVETAAHRVLEFDHGGVRRELGGRGVGPGEFNFPAAITVDGDDLLIGDTLNFLIQRIEVGTLRPLESFGALGDAPGETPRIKGLAVDAADDLWVSDSHIDAVSLYAHDGTYLMTIGRRGAAPGDFNFPAGIAAHPDGRVAVADSFNRRIQIFRLIPSEEGGSDEDDE